MKKVFQQILNFQVSLVLIYIGWGGVASRWGIVASQAQRPFLLSPCHWVGGSLSEQMLQQTDKHETFTCIKLTIARWHC